VGLDRIRVVLVRPQHPGNVGAAARAMKNMGLADLVLVGSRLDLDAAAVMAVHARDVLERHRRVDDLAQAIGDCGLVVGTSGRAGDEHAECVPPRALAPTILAASARNDVALVFGPEDHGLTKEELTHCHRVLTIPSTAAYPSLNLAQAVLICSYELQLAADGGADAGLEPRTLAPAALGEQMFAVLERALRAIGFVHRDNGAHMMRAFRRLFGRAALDEYETHIVLGLARQIEWAAGRATGETLTSRADVGS
jgi:TrmH family RNA methyltransferase